MISVPSSSGNLLIGCGLERHRRLRPVISVPSSSGNLLIEEGRLTFLISFRLISVPSSSGNLLIGDSVFGSHDAHWHFSPLLIGESSDRRAQARQDRATIGFQSPPHRGIF